MIVGFFLFIGSAVNKTSPTFSRGGLAATFVVDLLDLEGAGAEFDSDVEHENAEDTSFTVAASFTAMTPDVHNLDVSGRKEEVRLVFRVGGTDPNNGAYLNASAPLWRPY